VSSRTLLAAAIVAILVPMKASADTWIKLVCTGADHRGEAMTDRIVLNLTKMKWWLNDSADEDQHDFNGDITADSDDFYLVNGPMGFRVTQGTLDRTTLQLNRMGDALQCQKDEHQL
jgi:hypothetical protein